VAISLRTLAAPALRESLQEDAPAGSRFEIPRLTGSSVEDYHPHTLMPQFFSFLPRGCRNRAFLAVAVLGWAFAPPAMPAQAHNGMPRAERHESRHQIYRLEKLWREAIVKGDTAALSSLLDDEYMAITPFGTLQNKQQTLDTLGSGRWRISSLNPIETKVRFYGTTALVTSLVEVQGTSPDGDISGNYRYTRVYARDPRGDWKIVHFEATRISPASSAQR
jgi:ketosteroid isomerase-like protein